jgi:hypothetical protein
MHLRRLRYPAQTYCIPPSRHCPRTDLGPSAVAALRRCNPSASQSSISSVHDASRSLLAKARLVKAPFRPSPLGFAKRGPVSAGTCAGGARGGSPRSVVEQGQSVCGATTEPLAERARPLFLLRRPSARARQGDDPLSSSPSGTPASRPRTPG